MSISVSSVKQWLRPHGLPLHRLSVGSISKRSRLEVRLKDRFQYELERPLHHAIPDSRFEGRGLCPHPSVSPAAEPATARSALYQFAPYLPEKSFYALRFDGLEGHSVFSRSAIIPFGQRIRFAQRFHLTDMDVQSPKPPGRISLRLDVYSPPQVLQKCGRLCIPSLPSLWSETALTAGSPRSTAVTPLPRYYGPILHPLAFDHFPGLAGYRIYLAPTFFSSGRGGLLQSPACPCHRAVAFHPAEVK